MSTSTIVLRAALAAQLPAELARFVPKCTGDPAIVESVPIGNGCLGALVGSRG